jgi:hypothetical protein
VHIVFNHIHLSDASGKRLHDATVHSQYVSTHNLRLIVSADKSYQGTLRPKRQGVQTLEDDFKEMTFLWQCEQQAQAVICSQHSEHRRQS